MLKPLQGTYKQLTAAWDGLDKEAYCDGVEDAFEAMRNAMSFYRRFVKNAALLQEEFPTLYQVYKESKKTYKEWLLDFSFDDIITESC